MVYNRVRMVKKPKKSESEVHAGTRDAFRPAQGVLGPNARIDAYCGPLLGREP